MHHNMNNTHRIGYAICVSIFSFWFTIRMLESLWPNAPIRPMELPIHWLILSVISFMFLKSIMSDMIKRKNVLYIAVLTLMVLAPILLGYLGLMAQMHSIGFVLME